MSIVRQFALEQETVHVVQPLNRRYCQRMAPVSEHLKPADQGQGRWQRSDSFVVEAYRKLAGQLREYSV